MNNYIDVSYSRFVNNFLWRNNAIKGAFMLSAILSVTIFIFFGIVYLYFKSELGNLMYNGVSFQFVVGSINQTFYANFFAFMSSFHVGMDNLSVDLRKFLASVYKKVLALSFILYLIPSLFFITRPILFFKLVEVALFNMGIGSFLMLLSSAWLNGYLTVQAKSVSDIKNKNSFNFSYFILWFLAGFIIWFGDKLASIVGDSYAHIIIIGVEVIFVFSYSFWLNVVIIVFKKVRYKKLSIYLSI
ncbi:hypothetical protein [Dyadobacter sp. 32]|uniref:hypothetical protein n=1 Tax=Dyadobacter sp. 32 TaxID=538966 RepID=UPI0011ECC302